MLSFHYVITDEAGIHARPAGILAKEAKKYKSRIIIKNEEKAAEATMLMEVMELDVQCGQTVEVEVSGADEDVAYTAIKAFFEANM